MVVKLITEKQITFFSYFAFNKNTSDMHTSISTSHHEQGRKHYINARLGTEETLSFQVLYIRLHNESTLAC